MNNKGQIVNPILVFVGVVAGLLLIGPVLLKVFLSVRNTFGDALGNVSGAGGAIAKANVTAVLNPLVTMWDKIIIIAFIVAIILLFISAFEINSSPYFVVLYIVLAFLLVIFTPNMLAGIDNIYQSAIYAGPPDNVIGYLPFLAWLENNFVYVLVGIIFITGVIIYGKAALNRGGGRRA